MPVERLLQLLKLFEFENDYILLLLIMPSQSIICLYTFIRLVLKRDKVPYSLKKILKNNLFYTSYSVNKMTNIKQHEMRENEELLLNFFAL